MTDLVDLPATSYLLTWAQTAALVASRLMSALQQPPQCFDMWSMYLTADLTLFTHIGTDSRSVVVKADVSTKQSLSSALMHATYHHVLPTRDCILTLTLTASLIDSCSVVKVDVSTSQCLLNALLYMVDLKFLRARDCTRILILTADLFLSAPQAPTRTTSIEDFPGL